MNMREILLRIEQNGVISEVLNDLIRDHEIKHDKMLSNYKRYKASEDADGVPVFSRKFEDQNKINRKVNSAFDVDIIDTKLGYMAGNPVIYELDREKYPEQMYKTAVDKINEINIRNNVEDLDGETLKMASICGYGARLLYFNEQGLESILNIKPWECIFINDGALDQPQYAMRYYEINDSGKRKIYVEWYDDTNITFYISNQVEDEERTFQLYEKNGETQIKHLFDDVPLIQFVNNDELQGDCDKVYRDIDAYDYTLSDIVSEIEQFRLAYMAMYGLSPSEEDINRAKKTGAFGLPDTESKIEFITKDINDDVIEHNLDRLEENIYRFAKSVNFSDEAFAGTVTGIAMKFKMFGLESKCIITERKFTSALRRQYKLLSKPLQTKGVIFDYLDLKFIWTRNFPLNLLDEATTTAMFKGLISEKTRLGLLSFIDDPEAEIGQMDEGIDLDD